MDHFGEKRLHQGGKSVLSDLLQNEEIKDGTLLKNERSHEAVRIVDQAKFNNLRYRAARLLGFESGLEQEDVNDSLKKALIALQTKNRRGFESNYD